MNNECKTPRFLLSSFFSITTTFAYLFTDKMSTEDYKYVMVVILGAYGVRALLAHKAKE